MRDGLRPWRVSELPYLEREINYWHDSRGYAAASAAVHAAQLHAARHGMERVMVLPDWCARYEASPREAVAGIDADGLVADCDGALIIVLSTEAALARFQDWCARHVRWDFSRVGA